MQFPLDDAEFKEFQIDRVEELSDGSYAITCDGWTLWCGKENNVTPEVGQVARQYGQGIGSPVRGLFVDGQQFWYRTSKEQAEHLDRELYGSDAKEWLARWDDGRSVWSVEMGGIGPGYEQAIQIAVAEMIRWFIENQCDASRWSDPDSWKETHDQLDKALLEATGPVSSLGLSGPQWGAALNLAPRLYRYGPREVLANDKVKERLIQVQNTFPQS